MDRFAALNAFVAVAREGSFVGAAAALDMSKAAISKQVRGLEEHLGVALFARTSRALSLTETGRRFLGEAEDLLTRLANAERAVQGEIETPAGVLKISASVAFGARFVAPCLSRFLQDFPRVEGRLDLSDDRVDLIEDGYDLAVRITRTLPDASLRTRTLGRAAFLLVGAPGYFKRRAAPETPEDLAAHQCLDYAYGRERRLWRFADAAGRTREVRVAGPLTANAGEALMEAAIAGLGLARLPGFIADGPLRDGRLVSVLDGWAEPPLTIHAVTAPERAAPARIRFFVDRLAKALRTEPWLDPHGLRDDAP